jgi:hypothetical protein
VRAVAADDEELVNAAVGAETQDDVHVVATAVGEDERVKQVAPEKRTLDG